MANSQIEKEKKEEEPKREIDLESAIEILRTLRQKEKEATPEKIIETALKGLPTDARERLQAKLDAEREDLLNEGIDKEVADRIIAKRAEKEALTFREVYEDKRFTVGEKKERMSKDEYAKAEVQDEMDKIFSNKPEKEDLEKIARLSFDANGLKAVNDLSGSHEKGTEFLKRIAEVFHNPEGPTRKWLKEKGITKILATTGGGDEYGVILVAEKPIEKETIDEAIRRFEDEVKAIDVAHLIDLKDPEVLLRAAGISEKEANRMSKEERTAKIKEFKKTIPEGFEFLATISGGGTTLAKGLEHALKEATPPDKRFNPDKDNYHRALEKIMGGIWDVSDINAKNAKDNFKNMLKESKNPKELFYSKLISRTTEEALLTERNTQLLNKIEKQQNLIKLAEEKRKAGFSSDEILKELIENLKTLK